jgi:CheY-like chemotaxis protein
VLGNLLANALRYTPEGGVLLAVRRRGAQWCLQVWDTGIGIAPEQRELIFEEFYQAGNPGRDPQQGLGLGLAIVRRLTSLLDLPLALASVPGRGTCFALTLPRAHGSVEASPVMEEAIAEQPFAGRMALVLDDDAAICDATVGLLARWGMSARGAHSTAAAAALLEDGMAPDVILADLRLAEAEDGIAAVHRLRAVAQRAVPALLISGDTGARELARVQQSGLTLLTKPVAPARLRAALHALLDSAEARAP